MILLNIIGQNDVCNKTQATWKMMEGGLMTNKFTIEPELSLLYEIRKKLEKDFKGVGLDLYKKHGNDRPTIRVYFEIDIESNTPSGIIDEVMDFWNKLRQHFKLEIIKN